MTTISVFKQRLFLERDDAMAKIMTASKPMTDGQIENVVSKLRDALRKHRSEFGSEYVQHVLGVENLGMDLMAPFYKRVEVISNMIIRHIKVDPNRTPQQMLDATGCKQYVDKYVMEAMPMPRSVIEERKVFFFKLDRYVSDTDLEEEYKIRGLKPVDPSPLAAVNEADPAFADSHPNATHWRDSSGKWCFISFCRWLGERKVGVDYYSNGGWHSSWWFAGIRK